MTAQASTPPVPAYGSATPTAEIEITADLVRSLLVAQHPDLADLPISFAASGWDNAMFRLGQDLAVRLPRREAALSFSVSEQRWLPTLSLPLKTPTPLRLGQPGSGFPWPWSVVPWIEGETADLDQPDADQGQALAGFFRALHVPAPNEAPLNPYRGVPLNVRVPLLEPRLEFLAGKTGLVTPAHLAMWQRALAAPMDAQPTWLHGDPHPRNVVVNAGKLVAFIDWGDMTRGDPAGDLGAIWMLLADRRARQTAMTTYGASEATWDRARGWAFVYGVTLLATGLVDDPRMATIAERTLANLLAGP